MPGLELWEVALRVYFPSLHVHFPEDLFREEPWRKHWGFLPAIDVEGGLMPFSTFSLKALFSVAYS